MDVSVDRSKFSVLLSETRNKLIISRILYPEQMSRQFFVSSNFQFRTYVTHSD